MMFPSSLLFIFSAILFIIIICILLFKQKYTLFQLMVFTFFYFFIVLLVNNGFFPFTVGAYEVPAEISYIPFKGLLDKTLIFSNTYLYMFKLFVFAIPFGFCLPILLKKASFKKVMLISIAILFGSEILRFLSAVFLHNITKLFDTGILILYALGILAGYAVYKLFQFYLDSKKKGTE